MSVIKFSHGQEVPISAREGVIMDEYFRLHKATPSKVKHLRNPEFYYILSGGRDVGKKAILDRHYFGDFPRPKSGHDPTGQPLYHFYTKINDYFCVLRWEPMGLGDDSPWFTHLVRSSHVNLLMYDVSNHASFKYISDFYHKQEGQDFATKIGARSLETSVKDNQGVSETIQMVITYGLIHCAEVALPGIRNVVAKRIRNKARVDK